MLKKSIALAAVLGATILGGSAVAQPNNDGVVTHGEFNRAHVGDSKFHIRQVFGSPGVRLAGYTYHLDGGTSILKSYNAKGDALLIISYFRPAGGTYHAVSGVWINNDVADQLV